MKKNKEEHNISNKIFKLNICRCTHIYTYTCIYDKHKIKTLIYAKKIFKTTLG